MSDTAQIAGYRLEEEIGQGGMGIVYRAHDVALDRSVALKLLSPALAADRDFRQRFLVESRLAGSLEHPCVVPIYDAGEADGQLYLAMRNVEGTDLKRLLLAEGKLDPGRAIAICSQLADALDTAHARGLVHRDVKPSNVLLDEQSHAYLADFGLTRRLAEQAPGFEAGLSLGTPAYVAPEQIEAKSVDGRADQYSLACLLHECLTGKPPFTRSSEAATLFAHLEEEPPAPPGLEHVLPRALAKDPAARYPNCEAFVADARRALGLEPKRARWPLAVAGLGAALLGAALLAFFLTWRDGGTEPLPGRDSLVRIDPSSNHVAATIHVGQELSAVAAGAAGVWAASRGEGAVWRIDPKTDSVALRVSAHGKPAELAATGDVVIVSNGPQDANLAVIDAVNGKERNVISLATGGFFFGSSRVAAGASGVWMATADRRVGRLDLVRNRIADPISLPPPHNERANAYFSGVAVAGDAVWVVGDLLDPRLWRIDRATGDLKATIRLPFAPKDVAVGERAVWVTSQLDDSVSRIDPETNGITATIPVGRGAAGVAVADGSVWVANAIDGTVSRIDPEALRVVATIDVEGSPDEMAAGNDGVWVISREIADTGGADDGTVRIGVLPACEGGFSRFVDQSLAGAELPLLERGATLAGPKPGDGVKGATVGGKDVELFFGCGDDTAEKALSEARRLVEQVGVDVLIGPTQIGEGFAIKEYARKHPEVTFVDAAESGQAVTLQAPAPNFFRFLTDAAQWMAGLGAYAYEDLGWRNVVTVANDEGFHYTQVAGFVADFCALGGKVTRRIWLPTAAQDYSPYLAQVPPSGVDGFLMAGYPPTTAAFVQGLPMLKGNLARKVVFGAAPTLASPEAYGGPRRLAGTVIAWFLFGPRVPAYTTRLAKAFPALPPDYFGSPFDVPYTNAMEATLQALETVDGDLSGGQRRFRDALARVQLEAPNGPIRLDENRQAVGPNYLLESAKGVVIRTIPDVEQTFGGYFRKNGPMPSRTSPPCKKLTRP